ncbi:MAG: Ppx/GppA phosphatase family protein [Actinomycetota bacterium]
MAGTRVRAAAVDIGSNTLRLLVRDDASELERRTDVVGLGTGVDASGLLSDAAMERAAAVLAEYGVRIRELRVERVRAVATSASRDASNVETFLDRTASLLGMRPEVITGAEEAALSFAGVAGAVAGHGPALVIDPGGGSTEFVFGISSVESSRSIDIGSVRLTERMMPNRPATGAEVVAAREHVAAMFAAVPLPPKPYRVIGVGGTFTSLAAIHLDLQSYDRQQVHGTTLTLGNLDALVDRLSGFTIAETAAIPSLDPKRAPVLLAGAVVAAEAVRHVGTTVTVSEFDLLDAIAEGLLR